MRLNDGKFAGSKDNASIPIAGMGLSGPQHWREPDQRNRSDGERVSQDGPTGTQSSVMPAPAPVVKNSTKNLRQRKALQPLFF